MGFLPEIGPDGQLMEDVDEKVLTKILEDVGMKFPSKYQVAIRRVRVDGWSVRKALEEIGILVIKK